MVVSTLGLIAFASSCVDQNGPAASSEESALVARVASTSLPIVQRMEDAFDTTAFHGVRRYFSRVGAESLEQVEEVGSDGAGRFGFEIIEVVSAPAHIDPNGYLIEAENAWRFAQLVRDPRIVNAERVTANYTVSTAAITPTVAGIDCIRLQLTRNSPVGDRPGAYEADVDPATGFVLAWREFNAGGQILSSVVYESFEYDGDLSGMTLKGRAFTSTPIPLGQPIAPQLSFAPHVPMLLPEGTELVAAEVMSVPSSLAAGLPSDPDSYLVPGDWLRLVATDGLEVLIFTHSGESSAGGAVAGELRISSELSWKLGYGRIDGVSFVVAGRMPMAALQALVASAF